jgi:phosphate-selective porin
VRGSLFYLHSVPTGRAGTKKTGIFYQHFVPKGTTATGWHWAGAFAERGQGTVALAEWRMTKTNNKLKQLKTEEPEKPVSE